LERIPSARHLANRVLKLIAVVVPLGLDTFAASAALGLTAPPGRERARIGLLFGTFEAGMTLLGYAAGRPLGAAVGTAGDYVAAGLLALLGLWILLGSEDESRIERLAGLSGLAALALGVSVSLDELAIGLSLGVLRVAVIPVAALVGLQALVVSQVGLKLGSRLGEAAREQSERLAGAALIVLALVLAAVRLSGG
jgi:putative Mn2+ efflux pump MntP